MVEADQSIFEVLDNNGCFPCPFLVNLALRYLSNGVVNRWCSDHRDVFLTDKEHVKASLVMACCSRSRTPVLELDL